MVKKALETVRKRRPSKPQARAARAGPALKLGDLRPAPYNPRTITDEAILALQTSLGEFGDISGLVWNRRTGHLVAGHQRLDALKRQHGSKLMVKGDAVVSPDGQRFPVRVVDWPAAKEKAGNLAANSPLLGGSFDPAGLGAVLAELNVADGLGSLLDDLRLAELLPGAGDLLPEPAGGGDPDSAPPEGVPAGSDEWITFSVPLTAAQHQTVMHALRIAKAQGCEKLGDCLHLMATTFVKEHEADE